MLRKLIFGLILLALPAWAQVVGCENSNTGLDSGVASVNAATGLGYSAPGGIGAVGFRIRIRCLTKYVSFHVVNVDVSPSSAPNTYDIGLYCHSGDCANGGNAGKLYLHTGPIAGRNFTNNRVVATVIGSASGNGTTLTLTGTFLPADFQIGGNVALTTCTPFNSTYTIQTVNGTTITVASSTSGSVSGTCTIKSTANSPPFPSSTLCVNCVYADACRMAFQWVVDGRTVCTVLPCSLPKGTYAAAIGTSCSSATATNCAQLLGDDDKGLIYPFVASSRSTGAVYDSSGLPTTISFPSINATSAVWDTTPGTSAPVKPVKLLIY